MSDKACRTRVFSLTVRPTKGKSKYHIKSGQGRERRKDCLLDEAVSFCVQPSKEWMYFVCVMYTAAVFYFKYVQPLTSLLQVRCSITHTQQYR